MSEIDKHYGGEADEREPAASRPSSARPKREPSVTDRAGEVLKGARDGAADAAGRLRESVSDGYERAQDWAEDSYDTLSRNAVYARRRSAAEINRGRRNVAAFVDENPIMVGVAGLAVGVLIGALLPGTRRENRLMGSYSDDVRREGLRYARDAAEHGREAISENLHAIAQPRDRDGP